MHLELHPHDRVEIAAGGGVDILCKAKGIPPPVVTWKLNGKAMTEPRPYVSKLFVDPLIEFIAATCLAESELEKREMTVELIPTGWK